MQGIIDYLKGLVEILEGGEVADGWYFDRDHGLCANVHSKCGEEGKRVFTSLFQSWEHFSGVDEYPIPCTDGRFTGDAEDRACKQWEKCCDHDSFYDGEQGIMRLSLVKHAIKELEKEL